MDDFEVEGLWAHLSERCPPVEKEEIANLIGRGLIKENSVLWRELKAFSSILTEIHTLEFSRPLTANANETMIDEQWAEVSLTTENLSQNKGKLNEGESVPSLDFNKAKKANTENEDQSDQQLTRRSLTSVDSLDFIMSIEDKICVAHVSDVLDTLRKAFREEMEELEAEIAILYSAMDSESDAIAAEKAATRMRERHKERNNGALVSSRAPKVDRFSPQGKQTSSLRGERKEVDEDECPDCQALRREHAPGRIRPKKDKLGEQIGSSVCARCEARGLKDADTERLDKGRSKVRSKLQAAKDEKHFLDLDI